MKRVLIILLWTTTAAQAWAGDGNPCLECDRQMRKTLEALQAWRRMHNGHYPSRLIELQDAGLMPKNGAICPDLLREGAGADGANDVVTSSAEKGDPWGTYEYELSDAVKMSLGGEFGVPAVKFTRQDWKAELLRRPFFEQVPILRCTRHRAFAPPPYDLKPDAWRNATVTGNVYWSSMFWEWEWMRDVSLPGGGANILMGMQGPPFSSGRAPGLETALDLRPWTCAFGDHPWWWSGLVFGVGTNRQAAATLHPFFQGQHGRIMTLDGAQWWLDGLVQIMGKTSTNSSTKYMRFEMRNFTYERMGLPVNRTFREASWLQGTVWTAPADDTAGWLVWHYRDGSVERAPMIYGKTTARFWGNADQLNNEEGFPEPVWKHLEPAEAAGKEQWLRLYRQSWKNPHPNETVTSLDFITNTNCPAGPFLISINALK